MTRLIFLRPDSYFTTRNSGSWNVDIYDKRGYYRGGYHLSSKHLAQQLKKYIVRTGTEPAVSMAGTWETRGGLYRSIKKLRNDSR
jgi:hypothetical protein